MTQYISEYASPLGTLMLAGTADALTGLWFEQQKYFASTLGSDIIRQETPIHLAAKQWLDAYFAGQNPAVSFPLMLSGSDFRRQVWRILRSIPYGQCMTYGAIAAELASQTGKRVSAQAVGGAVGHNPISILIPCHRVIGADGSLTGYAGGLERKRFLLTLEHVELSPSPALQPK